MASGVPKCGVFIDVTDRSRGIHSRCAVAPRVTFGDATSRASSPPVEWPTTWIAPASPHVSAMTVESLAARRRIEAVGWTSHTWTRTSRWRAPKRSSIARTRCSKYSNDASRAKPNMPGDKYTRDGARVDTARTMPRAGEARPSERSASADDDPHDAEAAHVCPAKRRRFD